VSEFPFVLPRLTGYVVEELGIAPTALLKQTGRPSPTFVNHELLDDQVRSVWHLLSIDARLLAYAWMQERSRHAIRDEMRG